MRSNLFFLVVCCLLGSAGLAYAAEKPNIVLIMADDKY